MIFELPPLPYKYDALEPYIDAKTMEIHYTKHHAGYVAKLNDAIKADSLKVKSLEDLLKSISKYKPAIRNNAGGHYNHSLFWTVLSGKSKAPSPSFLKLLESTFGSFEKFKEEFNKAAETRFGSGWAWLCIDSKGKLFITSTANQDNPLMDTEEKRGTPILGIDVWEHAYYLKYQNKRPDYVQAFWHVINWEEVERRYNAAKK